MGEIRRALQKEHERLCTLVTPVAGQYGGAGVGDQNQTMSLGEHSAALSSVRRDAQGSGKEGGW